MSESRIERKAVIPRGLDPRFDAYVARPAAIYFYALSIFAIVLSLTPGPFVHDLWCEGRTEFFNEARYEAMEYVRLGLGCKYDLLIRIALYALVPATTYVVVGFFLLVSRKIGSQEEGDVKTLLLSFAWIVMVTSVTVYMDIDVRVKFPGLRVIANSEIMLLFVGSFLSSLHIVFMMQLALLVKIWKYHSE